MHNRLTMCALSALIATGAAARGPDPAILQRTSAWRLNHVGDSCQIAGTFGEGQDAVTLEFRQFGPGNGFHLFASGKSLDYTGRPAPLVIEFEPDGQRTEDEHPMSGTPPEGGIAFEIATRLLPSPEDEVLSSRAQWNKDGEDSRPPVYDLQAEAKITRMRLSGPFARQLVFELGPMDKPMDAMRSCLDGLVTGWGIDTATDRSLSRRPVPRTYPGSWARSSDYPASMLAKGKSGVTPFRLMVDAAGEPTACIVQVPGNAPFDKITCDVLMRHAHFDPALDAGGRPVASYYVNTIRWMTAF